MKTKKLKVSLVPQCLVLNFVKEYSDGDVIQEQLTLAGLPHRNLRQIKELWDRGDISLKIELKAYNPDHDVIDNAYDDIVTGKVTASKLFSS